MHVRPPPLITLQRSIISEGLLYNRLMEGWRNQNATRRYRIDQSACCQRARSQASTSRSQLLLSSRFPQQQRHFVVSVRSQEESSSSSSALTQVQTSDGVDIVDDSYLDTAQLSRSDVSPDLPVKSLREDPTYFEDIPITYEGAQKKLRKLESQVARDRYSQKLKKYLQECLSILKKQIEGGHTLSERLEILRSSIDRVHYAWLMSTNLLKDPRRINYHVKIARNLASMGDYCRRIGADRHSVIVLQASVGRHISDVIDFAETQVQGTTTEYEPMKFILDCLRSRSYSLQDEEESCKKLVADLLSRQAQWMSQYERAQREQIGSQSRRASLSQLENLVDALGSLMQITLDCSRGKTKSEKNQLAVDLFDWLVTQPSSFLFNSFLFNTVAFRFDVVVGFFHHPLSYLQETIKRLDQQTKISLIGTIGICLLRQGATLPAYNLFQWSRDINNPLSESLLRQMLRTFSFEKEFLMASTILEEIFRKQEERELSVATYRTIANYYATLKEDENVEKILKIIDTKVTTKERVAAEKFAFDCRLSCYSNKGDVAKATQLVEDRYDMRIGPSETPTEGLLYPDYHVHSRLVQVYLNNDQISEAESMLHRMLLFGHRPSALLLGATMEYYAKINDASSTLSLFKQMIEAKIKLNVHVYTTLITFFAKRGDVDGSEAVMKIMKKKKVSPDRVVYTALLNTYIEAERWQQAVDLFEYMKNHDNHKLQPLTAAYNSMLKAHVRRSIPIQQVYDFYKEMLTMGLEPSRETYGLVLQSAADAGMMDLAEDIFTSIEKKLGGRHGTKSSRGVDVFHFTTMIQGYLRQNLLQPAKAYAGEMRDRGYKGTGVLWNILAKVYIADDTSNKLEASRGLIRNAVFENANEYATAYSPLIYTLGRRALTEEVEGVFETLNEKKSEIPLPLWVNLLDGFRQQDNVEGALELWNVIYDKASFYLENKSALSVVEAVTTSSSSSTMNSTSSNMKADASTSSRSNLLCIPLSILIDLLAKHGKYEQIASEWIRCRKGGFAFNSHNWNHLCVSFLKAGRVQDSLNIIEKVLNRLPPSKEWRELNQDEIKKKYLEWQTSERSTLNEGKENEEKEEEEGLEKTDLLLQSPNRRHQSRQRDDRTIMNPILDKGGDEEAEPLDSFDDLSSVREKKQIDGKLERKKGNDQDILNSFRNDVMKSEIHSPWYAHLETMSQLSNTIRSLQDRGSIIQTGVDTFASIGDLYQRYPRVKELLDLYERKVEQNQDRVRDLTLNRGRI